MFRAHLTLSVFSHRSVIFPRSSVTFPSRMKVWGRGLLIATEVLLLLGLHQHAELSINSNILMDVFIHVTIYKCVFNDVGSY
jgi:hypothetical protein